MRASQDVQGLVGACDPHRWAHHVIDVDEYGLALEDMVGILAHAKTPLTD